MGKRSHDKPKPGNAFTKADPALAKILSGIQEEANRKSRDQLNYMFQEAMKMEPRPMRIEEQAAMQRENEELRRKLAAHDFADAQTRTASRRLWRQRLASLLRALGVCLALFVLGFALRWASKAYLEHRPSHLPSGCYFVREVRRGDAPPWLRKETWAIFQNNGWSGNSEVTMAPTRDSYFHSPREAWDFMHKWNLLPACK